MNVLITGATGFVGSALAELLRGAGHAPSALSRSADRARRSVPALSQVWSWDPLAGLPPEPALAEADAIVNLAGENVFGIWTASKRTRIHESRVRTTRHLVDGIRRAPPRPRVLVSGSAIGYYGERGDEELIETSPPGDGFLPMVCRDWEREAERAADHDVRVVTLRTGLVLDATGGVLGAMTPITKLGLGGPLGPGDQYWSWIDRGDLVALIRHAIETPISGALNATAPEPVSQRTFARALGRALGRPALVRVPAFALRLLGEFSTELLASRRVLPRRSLESGFTFGAPRLDAALARSFPA